MNATKPIYRVLCSAMALFCIVGGACNTAIAGPVSIEIRAQSLSTALRELARQSGIQLAVESELTEGKSAPALTGRYEATDALAMLLHDSGLEAYAVNDKTYGIRPRSKPSALPAAGAAARAPSIMLLASTDAAADEPKQIVETGSSKSKVSAAESDATDEQGAIPEILVRDSRLANTDIRRTEDAPQPYVVFDREQIDRSMASSLEDFLKTRLPMNTVGQTNAQYVGLRFGNTSSIDLRGLGAGQTLVLVNGRRMPGISDLFSGAEVLQPDINGIPLNAIERIEVLPSTASGIYGGGATGGVVNIILRRDYSGGELSAVYENTFASDAAQRRIEGSFGFSLEDGKTNIMLAGSYADSNRLLTDERDFVVRGRQLLQRNNPNAFSADSIFSTPRGATPNFRSLDGMPLTLLNGGSIGSRITSAPYGYAGVSSDGGAALAINAGSYNLELPRDAGAARQSLINNPQTQSVSASLRRDFGSRVEVFLDLSHYENNGSSAVSFADPSAVLNAGHPLNPFTNRIQVTYSTPELDFDYPSSNETRQAAGGFILRLPGEWNLQAEHAWSRSRFGFASGSALNSAGFTALATGQIDFTRDPNAHPFDYSGLLAPQPNFISGPFDTKLANSSLRIGGPIMQLPGGALSLTASVQHRDETAEAGFLRFIGDDGEVAGEAYVPERSQSVGSAYVEAALPLVSKHNARPYVRDLQLQLSARRDEYKTNTTDVGFGTFLPFPGAPLPPFDYTIAEVASTDFTFGVRYKPVESLALRASYGTGFLPPTLTQVFENFDPNGFAFGNDPKRGGGFFVSFGVDVLSGGSTDLKPEESRSWSAGLIFTPARLPGLRLSVDYTRIEKTDEIYLLQTQDILNNEDILGDRLTRAPLTPEDQQMNFTGGVITSLDLRLANLSSTELEAYDVQLDYTWGGGRFGSFTVQTLLTWQPQLVRRILPNSLPVDTVGFNGGVLEWRGNGGITWDRGPWTANWNMQYYDDHKVYGADFTPEFALQSSLDQGSDTIPAQIYHDLHLRYRFAQAPRLGGLFEDAEILVGIQNLLDTSPPIRATSGDSGGYSFYGDPRLRRYSLTLRKRF